MPVASESGDAAGRSHDHTAEMTNLWRTAGLSCDGDTMAMTAAAGAS